MAKPEQTRIDLTLDAASVEMSDATRTQQLRSPDFLNVAAYLAIHFVSTSVTAAEPMRWEIRGILQMRGTAQPLSLTALVSSQDHRIMFDASGELSRTAFGMTAKPLLVADTVRLRVQMRVQTTG
jgi:polyisoprenoid-binding protein YceI